jgi:hypothetical protein
MKERFHCWGWPCMELLSLVIVSLEHREVSFVEVFCRMYQLSFIERCQLLRDDLTGPL